MTEANTLLQQAESQCHTRGVRFTPIRRRVLELIAEHGGGLKAYDLLDQLSTEHAAARPPTTHRLTPCPAPSAAEHAVAGAH